MSKELGIYIHVPFCKNKCTYCDFYTLKNNERLMEEYVKNTLRHMEIMEKELKDYTIKSIYFGGGTPSILSVEHLTILVNGLHRYFKIKKEVEVTLEGNPEDITEEKGQSYGKLGINRVSLGVQTFNDEILKSLGRNHKKEDVLKAIDILRECGIDNISLDFIYGLPKEKISDIENNLKEILKLNIKHLSYYGLKIEDGTKLYKDLKAGKKLYLPDEDEELEMRNLINQTLEENGVFRYEISNYAKLNYESKHNLIYWENGEYISFGPNGSSSFKKSRYKNNVLGRYKNAGISEKVELQYLSQSETLSEDIILGLRLTKGINIEDLNKKYCIKFKEKYKEQLDLLLPENLLILEGNTLRLSTQGMNISNLIFQRFI